MCNEVVEQQKIDSPLEASIQDFLAWEKASRDTIDVKRCYIDLAGDLVTGVLLSQIVYWFLPGKADKLRVKREDKYWLAKGRKNWWDECRISPKQFDRSIKILQNKGLVETRLFKFAGIPTLHVWLNLYSLGDGVKYILTKGENPFVPKSNSYFDQGLKSLTEITSENTNKELLISPILKADKSADFLPRTEASRYLFTKTRRKRWGNSVQRDSFEAAEAQFGYTRMVDAIDWALLSGISNIKSIISAARNDKNWKSQGASYVSQKQLGFYHGKKIA
jgi:hypothetical protein